MKLLLTQPNIRQNVQNNQGETPLFLSLENELNEEIALILIDSGCDVNIGNYEDVTPLHLAVRWKSTNVAHKLIKKGADINFKDQDGYSPLHEAATKDRFDNVCMLLYYNVSVNEKTTFFQATPFHMACNYQYGTETAKCLIDYVADIDEMDSAGCTPLPIALNNKSNFAIDIMKKGADVNLVFNDLPFIHFSFLYETNEVFLHMWQLVNCNVLLDLNYPLLSTFLNLCQFPMDQFLKCLYVIFESPFIENFICQHRACYNDSLFSYIIRKKMLLKDRIEVFYLFLSYGITLYFNDICLLYDIYSFDQSFECLLASGCCIELNKANRFNLLVSRICFNNLNIYVRGRDYFTKSIFKCDRSFYYKFYSLPENACEEQICRLGGKCGSVPTLLELGRNAVRQVIFKTCNKPYAFNVYSAILSLNVPVKIRDILFLKQPIYNDHGVNFHVS